LKVIEKVRFMRAFFWVKTAQGQYTIKNKVNYVITV